METSVIRVAGALLTAGLSWISLTAFPPPSTRKDNLNLAEETRRMVSSARSNIDAGNFELALYPALELHKHFPENHVYLEQLATVYGHLRRYREEAETWELYLTSSPVPIEGCPQVGIAWRNQGDTAKALDALNRCLGFEANNPDVLYQIGYTTERTDPEKSDQVFRSGLKYAPNDPDLILGLGRVQLRLGRVREALDAARGVIGRLPDNTDALLLGGLALTRLNQLEEASRLLAHGAEVSPKYSDIRLALAAIAERRRDFAGAAQHYQRVLESDPENGEASLRLAAIRSGNR